MLENYEPKAVFKFFEEISAIPRGSGNEKAISDHMVKFAKDRNLWVHQDSENNVIIKKKATTGYENAPIVIIQGHLDMVAEKNNDVTHDFLTDGLKLIVEGDYIKADGTTLGADNGVAIAYAMAILDSNDIQHPELEVVMTTGEEIGLLGAAALDPNQLNGKLLLNLDSHDKGIIWVSCAGGMKADTLLNKETVDLSNDMDTFLIELKGLKGGHSGIDINAERGNSIRLTGRVLNELFATTDAYIVDINGGSQDNAIPRECVTTVAIPKKDKDLLFELVSKYENIFKNEYRVSEPDLKMTVVKVEKNSTSTLTKELSKKIVAAILLIPIGVSTMSLDIEGLVESSNNLGVIKIKDNDIIISSAIRSSVTTKKYFILEQIKTVAESIGAKTSTHGDYPGWEYNPDSKMRDILSNVYKNMYGEEVSFQAVHAGLECGYFAQKISEIDMVSYGPVMYDIHTPDERLSISSTKETWEYTLNVLAEMNKL